MAESHDRSHPVTPEIEQSVEDWRDELLWDIRVGNGTDAIKDSIDGLIAAARADAEAERERLTVDIQAYRGALGYDVPGRYDGRLSDGTYPKNGLSEALEIQLQRLTAALEQREQERDAARDEANRLSVALADKESEFYAALTEPLASSPTAPEET